MKNMRTKKVIQDYIDKHGEDKILENGIVLSENERPIPDLSTLAIQICCLTECENCPVVINNYDKRSKEGKESGELCVSNLYKWIIDESIKTIKKGD